MSAEVYIQKTQDVTPSNISLSFIDINTMYIISIRRFSHLQFDCAIGPNFSYFIRSLKWDFNLQAALFMSMNFSETLKSQSTILIF